MKTRILIIIVLFLSLRVSAQRKISTDKLQVKQTKLGAVTDSLLVRDLKGNVKHIPKSQLIPKIEIPGLDKVLNEDNTSSENIVLSGFGDKLSLINGGNGTKSIRFTSPTTDYFIDAVQSGSGLTTRTSLEFRSLTGIATVIPLRINKDNVNALSNFNTHNNFTMLGENIINNIEPTLKFRDADNAARTGSLGMVNIIDDRKWLFPDKDIIVAGLSDIPSTNTFVPYSNATSNLNLGIRNLTANSIFSRASGSPSVNWVNLSTGRNFTLKATTGQTLNNVTVEAPTENGKLALKKDVKANVITSSTQQTNITLNAEYPIVNYPIGTIAVHRRQNGLTTEVRLFIRVASSFWVRFSGSDL